MSEVRPTEKPPMPGMVLIEVDGERCYRCEHEWIRRDKDRVPTVCPKCKSPYWNRPRRTASRVPS